MSSSASLRSYTLSEVASHNTADSLWLIIEDKVYDVTAFKAEHPGGEEVLLENAGKDSTVVFQDVGHSADALQARDQYLIGQIVSEPPQQQDGRCDGSCKKWLFVVGVVAVAAIVLLAYRKYK
ncbi:cytochrome b5-like [Halichondria panicea]|uniref:cytochrome b5-like n=1 Tax=Halichondria panicea TaxID=6063 RepID=UPI00312BA0D2